jgi:hypothetical protein
VRLNGQPKQRLRDARPNDRFSEVSGLGKLAQIVALQAHRTGARLPDHRALPLDPAHSSLRLQHFAAGRTGSGPWGRPERRGLPQQSAHWRLPLPSVLLLAARSERPAPRWLSERRQAGAVRPLPRLRASGSGRSTLSCRSRCPNNPEGAGFASPCRARICQPRPCASAARHHTASRARLSGTRSAAA